MMVRIAYVIVPVPVVLLDEMVNHPVPVVLLDQVVNVPYANLERGCCDLLHRLPAKWNRAGTDMQDAKG